MSFDDKKVKYTEADDLNIKSHLNTSLEAEGISVSEDLIRKTLNAINVQKNEKLIMKKPSAFPFRQVRTLVSVAAAIIVLVVGFNAIRIFGPGGMKSDNTTDQAKGYDMDSGAVDEEESMNKEDILVYDIAMDSSEDELESKANQFAGNIDGSRQEPANKMLIAQIFEPTFTEMTSINLDKVESITILSMDNNQTMVLTKTEQIQLFYSIMDSYSYQETDEKDTDSQYVIDIIADDLDSRIIVSQSGIAVEHNLMDVYSSSIYSVSDQSKLIEDLVELMSK